MVRSNFSQGAERICDKNFLFSIAANLDNLFHRNILLYADKSIFCQQDNPSIEAGVNGILHKGHLPVFHPHVKQAFHLGKRVFFNLFRHMPVAQAQLGFDQHGNKFPGSCLMGHGNLSLAGNDCGIGRTSAHIQNGKGQLGARGCKGSEACHHRFHAGYFYICSEFQF